MRALVAPGAVVDEIGRVDGVDPRANTNLPTMGAAEYIATTPAVA